MIRLRTSQSFAVFDAARPFDEIRRDAAAKSVRFAVLREERPPGPPRYYALAIAEIPVGPRTLSESVLRGASSVTARARAAWPGTAPALIDADALARSLSGFATPSGRRAVALDPAGSVVAVVELASAGTRVEVGRGAIVGEPLRMFKERLDAFEFARSSTSRGARATVFRQLRAREALPSTGPTPPSPVAAKPGGFGARHGLGELLRSYSLEAALGDDDEAPPSDPLGAGAPDPSHPVAFFAPSARDRVPRVDRLVRVQPLEALPDARPADQVAVHWNTRFPRDEAAQKRRVLLTSTDYLLETVLEGTADPRAAAGVVIAPGTLFPSRERVPVRFGIEATGAGLRRPGQEGPHVPSLFGEPIDYAPGERMAPFVVEVCAPEPGLVVLDLTLFVRGAAALRQRLELKAIAVADDLAPAAPASTMSAGALSASPRAEVHLGVGWDGAELFLDAMMEQRITTGIRTSSSRVELEAAAMDARAELVKLSNAYQAEAPDPDDPLPSLRIRRPADALAAFAKIGSALHRALFGAPGERGPSRDLTDLADLLRDLGRARRPGTAPPRMQLSAEYLPFPWGVLYDGPDPALASVDPAGFWGVRFQIDRTVRGALDRMLLEDFGVSPTLRGFSCIDPTVDPEQGLTVAATQAAFFQRALPGLVELKDRDALVRFLADPEAPCDLLYFFCHAEAASTINQVGIRVAALAEKKTKIILGGRDLTIEDMRLTHPAPLPGRPLVFMNACSSAQDDVAFHSLFVTQFVARWGAAGFVGTDWKVPSVFADGFSRLFLRRFLGGLTIAAAFRAALSEALALGNPFPLIYALYVRPDLSLSSNRR